MQQWHQYFMYSVRVLFWGFFAPQMWHVAPMGVKFGVEESSRLNFIPIDAGVGVWGNQNWKFYAISECKYHTALELFLRNSKDPWRLHARSRIKIWVDSLKGYRNLNAPNFLHLLAAILYVGCEYVSEAQEWYKPPLSPCQLPSLVGVGLYGKKFDVFCLFLCTSHFWMTKFVNATLPWRSWST